jgi:putative tryptophan/tyrosine transport system substrate-binding protein
MRRRDFIAWTAATTLWRVPARAQSKRPKIGWLVFGDPNLGPVDRSLKNALLEASIADRTAEIIYRYANGRADRLDGLAEELVVQRPDVLIGIGGDVVHALVDASKGAIPVVGGVSDSPMRSGLAESLGRPGRNFTGLTFLTDEMAGKRMELLREIAPKAGRVAVIYNPQHLDEELKYARGAAAQLEVELSTHPISKVSDLDDALHAATAASADGVFIISSRLTGVLAANIARYGQERGVPVIASWREFADAGALVSYGPSRIFEARRLAGYVRKVLDGAKPAILPIEQPVKFELVVNLRTARIIGLPIGKEFILRADEVIE